ncbi:hypothetical protein [Vibrio phage RYC]|nr:hypothetical protein [Vibrio phage RYC]
MKLSRNSIIGKMNSIVGSLDIGADANQHEDMCPWFWKTVWNSIVAIIILSVAFLAFSALGVPLLKLLDILNPEYALLYSWVFGIVVVAVLFGVVLGLALSVSFGADKWIDYRRTKRELEINAEMQEDYVTPKWKVFTGFLKAKKEKYCPRIEWVD